MAITEKDLDKLDAAFKGAGPDRAAHAADVVETVSDLVTQRDARTKRIDGLGRNLKKLTRRFWSTVATTSRVFELAQKRVDAAEREFDKKSAVPGADIDKLKAKLKMTKKGISADIRKQTGLRTGVKFIGFRARNHRAFSDEEKAVLSQLTANVLSMEEELVRLKQVTAAASNGVRIASADLRTIASASGLTVVKKGREVTKSAANLTATLSKLSAAFKQDQKQVEQALKGVRDLKRSLHGADVKTALKQGSMLAALAVVLAATRFAQGKHKEGVIALLHGVAHIGFNIAMMLTFRTISRRKIKNRGL